MFSSLHGLQKNIIFIFEFKGRSDGEDYPSFRAEHGLISGFELISWSRRKSVSHCERLKKFPVVSETQHRATFTKRNSVLFSRWWGQGETHRGSSQV